jgi:hypothetical protein
MSSNTVVYILLVQLRTKNFALHHIRYITTFNYEDHGLSETYTQYQERKPIRYDTYNVKNLLQLAFRLLRH